MLLSYSSFDGDDGWHGASGVVTGTTGFLDDFGRLKSQSEVSNPNPFPTVDGFFAETGIHIWSIGLYGQPDECGLSITCEFVTEIFENTSGVSIHSMVLC